MSEKRGNTGKLKYDFPTEGVLEVQINEKWYRVTSRSFRSFEGLRRITRPLNQPGIGDSFTDVKTTTEAYNGPVYLLGTNQLINNITDGDISI